MTFGSGRFEKRQKKFVNGLQERPSVHKGNWYYVYGEKFIKGRLTPVAYGPFADEDEAYRAGYDRMRGIDFEVAALDTRNLSEATRQLKAKKLEQTRDLERSLEKMSHKR